MADITANVDSWSSTESSNSPSGATNVGTGLDDNLRAIQAAIAADRERGGPALVRNLGLAASVGSSALTIALKGKDLNDPSATNKVIIPFRSATAGTGDYSYIVVSAATSLVISSGSTLGTRSGIPFRLWVVAFNDGGTFRLGVINCVSTSAGAGAGSDVTRIYPLAASGIASSTAEGGAGGADSSLTFYTGTAVAAKAYAVLGYINFESGQGTAGTWATTHSRIQQFAPETKLPGMPTGNMTRADTGIAATGTTAVPSDDSIPQINEGDAYIDPADITPTSAANILEISAIAHLANSNVGVGVTASIHLAGTNNAYVSAIAGQYVASNMIQLTINKRILAASTSALDWTLRAGGSTGATTTFNGAAGGQQHGGVANSFLQVQELMG